MALLDRLTLHGEALAIALSVLQDQGPMPWAELVNALMPSGSSAEAERELRATLWDLGLVEEVQGELSAPLVPSTAADRPLQLLLLHRLNRLAEPGAPLLAVYHWLLSQSDFDRRVLNRDEVWPLYNQSRMSDEEHAVALNTPKMASWLRLASYIGLVIPQRSNTFVLQPTLSLVEAFIDSAIHEFGRTELSMSDAIAWWESNFCPIQSRPGCVHAGYSDALLLLESHGRLRLQHVGDAQSVTLDRRTVSHLHRHPSAKVA
jgi:hypothetical protein